MKTPVAAVVAATLLLAACGDDDTSDDGASASTVETTAADASTTETPTTVAPAASEAADAGSGGRSADGGFSLYDFRYCEILMTVTGDDGAEVTEVWGTPGVDPCTDEAWYALDADAIQAENEASFIVMNGPRHFIVDGTAETAPGSGGAGVAAGGESEIRDFGGVSMALLATTEATEESVAYVPDLVVRTTTWTYQAGTEVYELTDPEGNTYTMQSYALVEAPDLTAADLAGLGARLDLPEGWSFGSRVLEEDLQLGLGPDGAIVVQDDLRNAYQRNG